MQTYTIATLQPRPSMSQDKRQIQAGSYQDAVQQCRESWAETGRSTSLHSGTTAVYYWHRIDAHGNFVDRNRNSGVPESGRYSREAV